MHLAAIGGDFPMTSPDSDPEAVQTYRHQTIPVIGLEA